MDKKAILKKSVSNVWNPNDTQFTPAPSTSTGPGGQVPFQRPRAYAPTGKIDNESGSIVNGRTIPKQLGKTLINNLPKKEIIKSKMSFVKPVQKEIPPQPAQTPLPPAQ